MPDSPVAESQVDTPKPPPSRARRVIQVLLSMGVWIAAVFLSAGRLDWTRGWICVTAYVLTMLAAGILIRLKNPSLMEARARLRRKDTKPFDKIILSVYVPLSFFQPALAGLDAARFHWSSMPFATVYVGLVVFELSMALITWVMMVNPFAESTVRIQTDRNHRPISTGPYRFIRHPMYAGAMLMYPACALMLGSLWALALSGVIATLFVLRTALEDQTLRRELPGYEEFAAATRYRLIPGVW